MRYDRDRLPVAAIEQEAVEQDAPHADLRRLYIVGDSGSETANYDKQEQRDKTENQ